MFNEKAALKERLRQTIYGYQASILSILDLSGSIDLFEDHDSVKYTHTYSSTQTDNRALPSAIQD